MNKKKKILFWITGLSGSGKSTIGKLIKKDIERKYGKTLIINGDDLRKIFKINNYEMKERLETGKKYINLCSFVINQNINVIFTVVGLFNKLHKINRKIFTNYVEIYIKSDIKKLRQQKRKKFYLKKTKNVWGIDLKPQYPKNPHITIENNGKKSLKLIKSELLKKIDLVLKYN